MTTAVIGLGNLGKVVARELVDGRERVVLASRKEADAEALAEELGKRAAGATVEDALAQADVVVLALAFETMKEFIEGHKGALAGKVVVDPSNPVGTDEGGHIGRTLPDGVSSGSVIAGMLPPGAHYVKAFGTLSAGSLRRGGSRCSETCTRGEASTGGCSTAPRPKRRAAGSDSHLPYSRRGTRPRKEPPPA